MFAGVQYHGVKPFTACSIFKVVDSKFTPRLMLRWYQARRLVLYEVDGSQTMANIVKFRFDIYQIIKKHT